MWDRVFGTYTPTVAFDNFRYGLDGFDERNKHFRLYYSSLSDASTIDSNRRFELQTRFKF